MLQRSQNEITIVCADIIRDIASLKSYDEIRKEINLTLVFLKL